MPDAGLAIGVASGGDVTFWGRINVRWSIPSAVLAEGRRSLRVHTLQPSGIPSSFSPPLTIRVRPVTASLTSALIGTLAWQL